MANEINLGKYSKTITAVIAALVVIATKHFGADNEALLAVELLLAAVGVWAVPNTDSRSTT